MNLTILVTKDNMADMAATAEAILDKQKTVVNGGLCVVHDVLIPKEEVEASFKFLSDIFKSTLRLPVEINNSLPPEVQLANLFGSFVMQGYSRFPGAWVVIDSKAFPTADNFFDIIEKQHNAYGGKMTGLATVGVGTLRPVGPVVIDLTHKSLKFLRFPVGQSWRDRGQFLFSRCKFHVLNTDEYVWSLSENHQENKEVVEPDPQEAEEVVHDFSDIGRINSWKRDKIVAYITKVDGKKPHHNLGYSKLVNLAETIAQSPA